MSNKNAASKITDKKPLLLYFVMQDWYFYSHRLPQARAAMEAGYDVAVVTKVQKHKKLIENEGIRVVSFPIKRRAWNPLQAFQDIAHLVRVFRSEKPHVVHNIAFKPVLYGTIAARLVKVPHVIDAFAGLGFLYTDGAIKTKTLRLLSYFLFRLTCRAGRVHLLFQNRDDMERMMRNGVGVDRRATLIEGSGVDTKSLKVSKLRPYKKDGIICAFAGRMIKIKGLETMKKAFEILQERGVNAKLWLCGTPDVHNPGSWLKADLKQWEKENQNVQWLGHQTMSEIWPKAHIALQPSLGGEGVPKSLLEAAACGRAVIATDVPGCREVVQDGKNGYLVPPGDAKVLADAIEKAVHNADKLKDWGVKSREIAEKRFSVDIIQKKTRALYEQFLPK